MSSTQINLNFIYKTDTITIQCRGNEYMKDIYKTFLIKSQLDLKDAFYLYNGNLINPELKLEQINNNQNELSILVQTIDEDNINVEKKMKQSKEIICPECKEICFLNINDYKINLFKCKNGHIINNILFDEFGKSQEYSEYSIICSECKKNTKAETHENIFFKCCKCQKDLCPLCQIQKHKNHTVINYDYKAYFCDLHGEKFTFYCKVCNKNLCDLCEHNNKHELIHLKQLVIDKNKILETNTKLRFKIDK